MKILVAEDTYPSMYLIQSLLTNAGYQVVTAENGAEALEKLRVEQIDLIISDVLMPQMDGFQFCREVKTTSGLRHIPFVVYTATYTGTEDAAFARSLGADAFLIKPLEALPFLQTIRELLERGLAEQPPPVSPSEELRHLDQPPPVSPSEELRHLDYFKQYNVRLVKKLESKVEDLDEANRRLRKSENLFHTLAQLAPVGIFQIDKAGSLLYANTLWSELTGQAPKSSADISCLAALHPDDCDRVTRNWQEVLSAGRPFEAEFRFLHPDGSTVWVWGQARLLPPSPGDPDAYVGTFTDISRQKQLEEEKTQMQARLYQAQKLEAIGTMVGGVAHDFNNLLGAILGYAELAQHGLPLGLPVQDDLSQLIRAAERARDITQQLLWFSRKRKEPFKPVEIAPIVREAIRLLSISAPANVTLDEQLPANLPSIRAHPTQIHQIALNLLLNAYYAMRGRSGVVRVALAPVHVDAVLAGRLPDLREGNYLTLTVRDTGSGIPVDVLPHIFDPFFTTKPLGEGSGMGLSVVHGIVREHGGAIDVESVPNTGTTFTIYFPAIDPGTENAAPIPEGGGARLLFVDDEELLQSMALRMLEKLRYRVTAFCDPTEALAAFRADPDGFDLVLTDLDMPKLTGLELAAELTKIRPHLPIVLTTGVKQLIEPEMATALGIRELLLKPFDFRGLAHALAQALRGGKTA